MGALSLVPILTMLFLWKEDASYWRIGIAYAFIGVGVGFAGTPASERAGLQSMVQSMEIEIQD